MEYEILTNVEMINDLKTARQTGNGNDFIDLLRAFDCALGNFVDTYIADGILHINNNVPILPHEEILRGNTNNPIYLKYIYALEYPITHVFLGDKLSNERLYSIIANAMKKQDMYIDSSPEADSIPATVETITNNQFVFIADEPDYFYVAGFNVLVDQE